MISSLLYKDLCAEEVNIPNSTGMEFEHAIKKAETLPRLYSILVSRQGEMLLEKYFNGSSRDKLINIKSASKSVISALVGVAIDKGYIPDSNQPIGNYFSDRLNGESGQHKAKITIANLLSMQSGMQSTSSRNYGAWVLSTDWISYALNQPMEEQPGSRMRYSTGNTHLLSAILTRSTEQTTLEFARKNLATPMGFQLAEWPRDPNGIYFGGNDMEMTARQMLAFGELYLNKGYANGRQIISQDWINDSLQSHAQSTREQGRYYGYGWWIREMAGFKTSYAWGYGGQFIILVPDLELVVVTTSSSTPHNDRRSHRRELTTLLENQVIKHVATELGINNTGSDLSTLGNATD